MHVVGALILAATGSGASFAQSGSGAPTVSQPVVQPLPSREALRLNAALSKLGRDPSNVDALVEAGDAASALGDFEAASGFFKRAQQISKGNSRVMAGLAGALVLAGDPFSAIPLFADAEKAGADPASIAADRGLAYDLVGDTASAQRNYQMALAAAPDDEVSRRLAISLAISGDARGVERTLLPLLRRQDKAAWRARAFALAILGKTDEAIKITKTLLPPKLAEGITPYLGYVPRLTAAQQAAAANLGKFPRASEIGRDDPRVAQFAPQPGQRAQVAAVDRNLVPAGRPLGSEAESQTEPRQSASRESEKEAERQAKKAAKEAKREASRQARRVAPPEPKPARQAGSAEEQVVAAMSVPPVAPPQPAQPVPARAAAPAQPATAVAQAAAPAQPAGPVPQAVPAPAGPEVTVDGPGFDLASLPNSTLGARNAAEPAKTGEGRSFGEFFEDLGKPTVAAVPASGAVDIRKIAAAKPKPEPPKVAPPSHPSRIWVQLGIGQNQSSLASDWRRLQRQSPDLLKGRKAYVSKLNQTNRMLTGPFESNKSANDFISALRKAGFDGPYLWTSPAGQVVDAL